MYIKNLEGTELERTRKKNRTTTRKNVSGL